MTESLSSLPIIRCQVERRGKFSEFIRSEDIKVINSRGAPDFILKFGFGILRGEILTAVPYGVWSFHHGDERQFRGRPAGLWEIFHAAPTTGVILQRLTDALDGGIVLFRGRFATRMDSYRENLNQILFGATVFPSIVARSILAGNPFPTNPSKTTATIYYTPTNLQMVTLLIRIVRAKAKRIFYGLFTLKSWAIGVYRGRPEKLISEAGLVKVFWHRPKESHVFWADPFLATMKGKILVAAEELNYRSPIGKIVMGNLLGPEGPYSPRVVLEAPHHLSYPFLFEWRDALYCLPESMEDGRLTLYCVDSSTGLLVEPKILMERVAAIDPVLFSLPSGEWWLAFTDGDQGAMTHLMLYRSDSPLGPFTPHRLNPVKVDCAGARGAGAPFVTNGRLYRPAQDCSAGYGGSVVLNEIVRLTESEFKEMRVGVIRPFASEFPNGVHHISTAGGMTAIDGCQNRFHPLAFLVRAQILFRRRR